MDIVVIGAGGHGRVVLDIMQAAGEHNVIGFVDANPQLTDQMVDDLPVLGQANILPKLRARKIKGAIVAIGDNQARRSYAKKLQELGFELVNAVHPKSHISGGAKLGRNVVIAAGAMIGTESNIADSVIVNTLAVVEHECEIGEAAHICPAAALAGRVRIGVETFVGLGSRIIQCLSIGDGAVIGAGAVVIRDVPEGATVVGVPARIIQTAPSALETASF